MQKMATMIRYGGEILRERVGRERKEIGLIKILYGEEVRETK